MMEKYDHKKIESKWQKAWQEKGIYRAKDGDTKKKYYCLIEFPYPSGQGLHVGHIRSNTAMDIIARRRRAEGYNVLYPIGWDAFGLPTENYAIKTGIQPALVTQQNADTFRRQLKSLGFSFDWDREVNTTDPSYFKWTQWIFLKMYEKGLAYKKKMAVNWCPKDLIVLANEEVVGGCCERCGTPVEKREKEQWMLAITKYADRLDKDLDLVDFQERIKIQQRNWIGRSEGAEFEFVIENSDQKIKVFTTRADTLFGVTYVVLAPENPLVNELKTQIKNWPEVEKYIVEAKSKTEIERTSEGKEKTGVILEGITVANPVNGEKVPVWVADYVLANYGTGTVMAVPAHDERDRQFAKKYGLPIREVVIPNRIDKRNPPVEGRKKVERQNVQAVVKNPKTGKYLCLHSKNHDWNTFPMGGVNVGEDIIEAARREVVEESGYINLNKGVLLGGQVRAEYFAKHKDENRVSFTNLVYFELIDEEKVSVAKEESDENEVLWIEEKDLNVNFMVHAEMDIWLELISGDSTAYVGGGVLINSGEFSGVSNEDAAKKITEKFGQAKVTYKLRDWIFSRQHYWGEPIPMVKCEKCGWVPVPEDQLPITLPEVEHYQPTGTGESPLAAITDWVNTTCPKCGEQAARETDTMPNWAGSSWYYLRYTDPKNSQAFASPENLKYWTPVDWYNGGMEHTTLHLLYSRFWHKFLFDLSLVPTSEPYQKRTSHGMILAEGGEKMSKSKGNVINPDDIVNLYGADTLRVYEMFMGPFDQAIAWSTEGLMGPRRFLERVWKLASSEKDFLRSSETIPRPFGNNSSTSLSSLLHQTIKKVSEDIEAMRFNTAISSLMILVNAFEESEKINQTDFEVFLKLLAPFAPHLAEELWHELGHEDSIHEAAWPEWKESELEKKEWIIVVQVNGVKRDSLQIEAGLEQTEVENMAKNMPKIAKWLEGKEIKKTIYVPGKLVNFVV